MYDFIRLSLALTVLFLSTIRIAGILRLFEIKSNSLIKRDNYPFVGFDL